MTQEAKFKVIVDWIRQNIADGTWKVGDRLPTENQLAEQFGVSRQTVRHALDVLKHENVISKARGSGTYVGNVTKETAEPRKQYHNIAVISTYVDHYIFPSVLRGIENIVAKEGYLLQLFFTNDSIHHEKTILKNLIERNDADGIIVEPAKSALPNPNLELYHQLQDMNIPIIYFHAYYPELKLPCVRIDDTETAYKATRLLINAGHTEIAGIFDAEDGQGRLRYSGFLKCMWEHHLKTDARKTVWLDTDVIGRLERIEDYLFECLEGVTGVVCYNDEIAYDLINLALKRGIRIPEDLSVVSIDNSNLASMCSVPFTSFVHPKEELGRKLGENMLKLIRDPSYNADYIFEIDADEKQSIAPPSALGTDNKMTENEGKEQK